MRPDNFDANKVAEALQGTCMTLDEGISQEYEESEMDSFHLTEDDHTIIDNQIALCDTCGWWVEVSELCNEEDDCGGSDCTDCCSDNHEEEE